MKFLLHCPSCLPMLSDNCMRHMQLYVRNDYAVLPFWEIPPPDCNSNWTQSGWGVSDISFPNLAKLKEEKKFNKMDKVKRLTSENGVVIFSKSTCCLCYAVNILFQEIGVTPYVHEIDQDPEGREMEKALLRMGCNTPPVPAVFIGGTLVGSTNEVMSLHLSGSLNQLLKPYQGL
ncbi:hypothetical protein RHMOL_Rhmol13G0021000 [Rhododendron molle]|uniref:Uncharacterized protein n=1 Tax=Rhododendron molle TaxID=49168 RepID=A0ACC0L205_RHOML|nr:hypothetical protein RHMOL_Rhmol13G0021000 [Rhododendron molle]